MAVTEQTLREITALRVLIDSTVDATTARLIAAWATAWEELTPVWALALDELLAAAKDGRWPARRTVLRAEKARQALTATLNALQDLAQTSGVTITGALPDLVRETLDGHTRVVGSQYPPHTHPVLDRPNQAALDAIVRRVAGDIVALHRPLPVQAQLAMRASLIRGIAVGDNPRKAAADMLTRVRGDFDGGLNRALVIARTEMLDAHRTAAHAMDQANTATLDGWEWVSALDKRTCPSCWAMHGTRHPLDEQGPLDHQQGRCTRVSIVKPWRDLGFDVDEPPSLLPDAQERFAALSRDEQLAVMGPKRLAALDSGRLSWGDIPQRRSTAGWRDSYAPAPVG